MPSASLTWREAFVATFLERDLPQLGIRISSTRRRRFWQMLAHWQGQIWNANAFARSFEVGAQSVRHYLDLLCDTYVLRQLAPFHVNLKKRLVRSPKVYVRDTGLLHAILGIRDADALVGHPVLGASFEGFAIEQIAAAVGDRARLGFFATRSGAELDLVLELPGGERVGVEVEYTKAPRLRRGSRQALADTGGCRGYVVTAGDEGFPLAENWQAIPLAEFLAKIAADGLL